MMFKWGAKPRTALPGRRGKTPLPGRRAGGSICRASIRDIQCHNIECTILVQAVQPPTVLQQAMPGEKPRQHRKMRRAAPDYLMSHPLSRATTAIEPFWCSLPGRSGRVSICINMGHWTIVPPRRGVTIRPSSGWVPARPGYPSLPGPSLTEAFSTHEIQISR